MYACAGYESPTFNDTTCDLTVVDDTTNTTNTTNAFDENTKNIISYIGYLFVLWITLWCLATIIVCAVYKLVLHNAQPVSASSHQWHLFQCLGPSQNSAFVGRNNFYYCGNSDWRLGHELEHFRGMAFHCWLPYKTEHTYIWVCDLVRRWNFL